MGPETITDSQQTEYLHKCIFQDTKLKCGIGSCGTVLKEGKWAELWIVVIFNIVTMKLSASFLSSYCIQNCSAEKWTLQ